MSPRVSLLILLGGITIGGFWWRAGEKRDASFQTPVDKMGMEQWRLSPSLADFPADKMDADDPAQWAVAQGVVLDSRLTAAGKPGRWKRERLVQTPVQRRPVRVVEEWGRAGPFKGWVCTGRRVHLADQLILKTQKNVSQTALEKRMQTLGWTVHANITDRLYTIRLPSATLDAVPEALMRLKDHGDMVANSEVDGVGFPAALPNDGLFTKQWANSNAGTIDGSIAGIDVGAVGFWDVVGSAPGIIVAILDTGLDFDHEDLRGIEWRNPGENPSDGRDNDRNGLTDDVKGWDFVDSDNDPSDKNGHGTQVTGIIAANRNNGLGIAGMLTGVKIMTCKVTEGSGIISDLIAATAYARKKGASIINMSLQGQEFSEGLSEEFRLCEQAGILLCVAAGNQTLWNLGFSNDEIPNYPASYPHACILAVGNHREDGGRSISSNFGYESVDLFAPGNNVWTTTAPPANAPASSAHSFYVQTSGTSLSAPYVTAVAAAIKHLNPSWQAGEIKNCILASVTRSPSYSWFCQTGGRLNALGAISYAIRSLPQQDTDQDNFSNLFEYLAGTRADSSQSRPQVFGMVDDSTFRVGLPGITRPDAAFTAERSSDLVSWHAGSILLSRQPQLFYAEIPRSGGLGRFLRLRETVIVAPQPFVSQ